MTERMHAQVPLHDGDLPERSFSVASYSYSDNDPRPVALVYCHRGHVEVSFDLTAAQATLLGRALCAAAAACEDAPNPDPPTAVRLLRRVAACGATMKLGELGDEIEAFLDAGTETTP